MCSPMPDIDPEDIKAPGPCRNYPECSTPTADTCRWPACMEEIGKPRSSGTPFNDQGIPM